MKMPLMKNGKTDSMTAPCSRFVGLEMPFTKYRETPVSGVDYIKVGRTAQIKLKFMHRHSCWPNLGVSVRFGNAWQH